MRTNRAIAKDNINSFTGKELTEMMIENHLNSRTHKGVEVYPDGEVHVAEEADNNTMHYIDYPNKPVESIYEITSSTGSVCDCDVCAEHGQFLEMDKDEFIREYGEDSYEFWQTTSLEDALADYTHDAGVYEDDIRQDMLNAIDEIEYGYFEDEK